MTISSQPETRFIANRSRPVAALEVMFETLGRRDLLTRETWLEALADSVDRILQHRRLALHAFAFLPDRVRLLIAPPDSDARLPWMLFAMKRVVTQIIRRDLRVARGELWRELTARQGRGRYVFQVWEPGCGQLTELMSATEVRASIDSIHNAPVSRGLCDTPADWPWSSWRSYNHPEMASTEIRPHVTPWRRVSRSEPPVREEAFSA